MSTSTGRQLLPRGTSLDDAALESRTPRMWWLVALPLPVLLVYGMVAAPEDRPWRWTVVYAGALLLAAGAQVLFWRVTAQEHAAGVRRAGELARARVQIEAHESVSELYINLARRNQTLLDRQINLLVAMEEREGDPDVLAELFQLDHLATRIRRNAESLLVLSGEEPARRWGRPVLLADVVRAAVSEVEDFRRVHMAVDEGVALAGRAVADVAHLLAELIENGLQFSPPESRVRVSTRPGADGTVVVTVEDHGIGMPDADLDAANELLTHPPDVDVRLSKRLGFHVVARLAARDRVRVCLSATSGGGVTVTVTLPDDLVARPAPVAPTVPEPAPAVPPPTPTAPASGRVGPASSPVPTVASPPLVDLASVQIARPAAVAITAPPSSVRAPEPAPVPGPTKPLTRRVPQTSLDPGLRHGKSGPPEPSASSGRLRRTPEARRDRLSQFQAARDRARQAAGGDGQSG